MDLFEMGSETGYCFTGTLSQSRGGEVVGASRRAKEHGNMFFAREDWQPVKHLCLVEMDEYQISFDFADHGVF